MPNKNLSLLKTWEGVIAIGLCVIALISFSYIGFTHFANNNASFAQTIEDKQNDPNDVSVVPATNIPETTPRSIVSLNEGLAINTPPPQAPQPEVDATPNSTTKKTCDKRSMDHLKQQKNNKIRESEVTKYRMQSYSNIYHGSNGFKNKKERDSQIQQYEQDHKERTELYESEYRANIESIGCS